MSFEHFVQDPKGYIRTHQVFIGNSFNAANSVAGLASVALPGGGRSLQFTRNPAAHITMDVQDAHQRSSGLGALMRGLGLAPRVRRDFVVVGHPAGDVGFRFLPYREGNVTYLSLDPAATFFVTGPLTGCTVGAGKLGGVVWTFHSFAPPPLHGDEARNRQSMMINHVRNALGIPAVHLAVNRTHYTGQGFVFGRLRPGGVWKFYAYGSASGVRKFAEL